MGGALESNVIPPDASALSVGGQLMVGD